ncbi:hypothetical protein AB0D29_17870 [Streptomyces sp. NPDC048424]|uniref:hypothetical protein n=1 Tax=Streptomyces sp. NPDC048424 TaxID=3155265 RepID=UPI00341EF408
MQPSRLVTLCGPSSGRSTGGATAGIEYNRPERLERPSCRRSDEVRAVPAICVSGHSRYREEAGGDRGVGTLEVVPRLAEAPAVAPPPPVTAGRTAPAVLLVLVPMGTFTGGAAGGQWFADAPAAEVDHGSTTLWGGATRATAPEPGAEPLFPAWISAFALLGGGPADHLGRADPTGVPDPDRGRPGRRRGGLVPRLVLRAVVHLGAGRAMTLQEFRRAVWGAGGYGELAEVHRTTGTVAAPATDPPRVGR